MSQIRWGIFGVGIITWDFLLAIRRANLVRHKFAAIASRSSLDKAKSLAEKFGIERVYSDYDEMLANPEIDAVYIGLTHAQHAVVAEAALKAGKAVLCEKPMTTSVESSLRLVELSRQHNILLVEALWSTFCPPYARVRELLSKAEALSMNVSFTLAFPIRHLGFTDNPQIGYNSAMWGIGIYAIQMATAIFGPNPCKIQATGRLDENNVDRALSISLAYQHPDGLRLANLIVDTQSGAPSDCVATIYCKPGNAAKISAIRLAPCFWMPKRLEIVMSDGTVKEELFPLPACKNDTFKDDKVILLHSEGLAYEANAFAEAFDNWKANPQVNEHSLRTHEHILSDAKVMEVVLDMVRKQHGV